jgi:hypothetical protein
MRRQYENEKTPEGRMAAVARDLMPGFDGIRKTGGEYPDYADFLEVFKPYMDRELLMARVNEAGIAWAVSRVFMLEQQLEQANEVIRNLRR